VRRLGVVRLVRHYECDGVARHQTPEFCPGYGEDEEPWPGLRRSLERPVAKSIVCHSGLHSAVGVMPFGHPSTPARGRLAVDHPMVIIHEPVRCDAPCTATSCAAGDGVGWRSRTHGAGREAQEAQRHAKGGVVGGDTSLFAPLLMEYGQLRWCQACLASPWTAPAHLPMRCWAALAR